MWNSGGSRRLLLCPWVGRREEYSRLQEWRKNAVERIERGDHINVYKYLQGGCQQRVPEPFSGAQGQHKEQWPHTETQEILLKVKKFTLRVSELWDSSQGDPGVSLCADIQTHLMCPVSLLLAPCLGRTG